jgi:uncharacterized membrane protein
LLVTTGSQGHLIVEVCLRTLIPIADLFEALALAADILRTVTIPTWDEIGKLGAIVVLRTVLNYFLEREIEQEQKKAEYVLESAA